MIGTTELVVIVIAVLILFGASAIPKFARSLGEAKREFSKSLKEGEAEPKTGTDKGKGGKDAQA